MVLVTGQGPEGPETVRLYRHYDGYPDQSLLDIGRILSETDLSKGPAHLAGELSSKATDEKGRPDFHIDGGPWAREADPRKDDILKEEGSPSLVDWYYRIDTGARRVDVYGFHDGKFVSDNIVGYEKREPCSPFDYLRKAGQEYRQRVENACTLIERIGFGVSAKAPTEEDIARRALETLAGAPKDTPLGDLYDDRPDIASAVNMLIHGFEYPDHSWKTMGRILDEVEAARAKTVPPSGLDSVPVNERLLDNPTGEEGKTNKNKERRMAKPKAKKGAQDVTEEQGVQQEQASTEARQEPIAEARPEAPEQEAVAEKAPQKRHFQKAHPNDKPFALAIPYEDNDEAKKAGAVWFGALKTWAVPSDTKREPFQKWYPKAGEDGAGADEASTRAIEANRVFADPTGRKATLLLIAACESEKTTARDLTQLVLLGADPCAQQSKGATGLHRAAESGNVDCAKFLLDAGADVDARDHKGRTPLLKGAYYGSAGVVTELLKAGADKAAVDEAGNGFEAACAAGAAAKHDATPEDKVVATLAAFSAAPEARAEQSTAKEYAKARGR